VASFAYNPQGNGRWMSLHLKERKKVGWKKRVKKVDNVPAVVGGPDDEDIDMDEGDVRHLRD